jgi:very-short-patch-repair endonuclease
VAWDACLPQDGQRPTHSRPEEARDVCLPHEGEHPTQRSGASRWDVCRPGAWPDQLIAVIATRQQGVITRGQLFGLGLTRAVIDNAVARGRLIQLHRGVYALGHLSLPPLAGFVAATLAVGTGAYVSGRSAAMLWGLIPSEDGEVDITVVGRDAGRRRAGIRVHRVQALDRCDTTTLHEMPITTPSRALLDITPDLTQPHLERTFDAALKGRILTRNAVAQTVARNRRRPGAARLGALAQSEFRGPPDTRSDPERRFAELVRAAGLPEPEMNGRFGRFVVDALWRDLRLAVEIDGYEYHSTKRSFESDHERDQVLIEAGLSVLRFTADQVAGQPEVVLARLARRIGELQAQSGRSSRIVS